MGGGGLISSWGAWTLDTACRSGVVWYGCGAVLAEHVVCSGVLMACGDGEWTADERASA